MVSAGFINHFSLNNIDGIGVIGVAVFFFFFG
jgi:hypothetical protein